MLLKLFFFSKTKKLQLRHCFKTSKSETTAIRWDINVIMQEFAKMFIWLYLISNCSPFNVYIIFQAIAIFTELLDNYSVKLRLVVEWQTDYGYFSPILVIFFLFFFLMQYFFISMNFEFYYYITNILQNINSIAISDFKKFIRINWLLCNEIVKTR